jgi:hypothetical protein
MDLPENEKANLGGSLSGPTCAALVFLRRGALHGTAPQRLLRRRSNGFRRRSKHPVQGFEATSPFLVYSTFTVLPSGPVNSAEKPSGEKEPLRLAVLPLA